MFLLFLLFFHLLMFLLLFVLLHLFHFTVELEIDSFYRLLFDFFVTNDKLHSPRQAKDFSDAELPVDAVRTRRRILLLVVDTTTSYLFHNSLLVEYMIRILHDLHMM